MQAAVSDVAGKRQPIARVRIVAFPDRDVLHHVPHHGHIRAGRIGHQIAAHHPGEGDAVGVPADVAGNVGDGVSLDAAPDQGEPGGPGVEDVIDGVADHLHVGHVLAIDAVHAPAVDRHVAKLKPGIGRGGRGAVDVDRDLIGLVDGVLRTVQRTRPGDQDVAGVDDETARIRGDLIDHRPVQIDVALAAHRQGGSDLVGIPPGKQQPGRGAGVQGRLNGQGIVMRPIPDRPKVVRAGEVLDAYRVPQLAGDRAGDATGSGANVRRRLQGQHHRQRGFGPKPLCKQECENHRTTPGAPAGRPSPPCSSTRTSRVPDATMPKMAMLDP